MAGYSTTAEVRAKLSFFQPVSREPRTTDASNKCSLIHKPIADTDGDGSYTDEVTAVVTAGEGVVAISAVNNLTGEITTDQTSTAILVSYNYEQGAGHSGVVGTSVITTWNEDIAALIDSKLKKIYVVPFTATYPVEINKLSSDMVSAKIMMQLFPSTGSNEHSAAKTRWDMAEEFLKALEMGKAKIITLTTRSRTKAEFEDVDPIFNMTDTTYEDSSDPYSEGSEGSD